MKVVRCSEESLDNIDAALLTAEKCLESFRTSSSYSTPENLTRLDTSRYIPHTNSSDPGNSNMLGNHNNDIEKVTLQVPVCGDSSSSFDSGNAIEIDVTDTSMHDNDDSILPTTNVDPNFKMSIVNNPKTVQIRIKKVVPNVDHITPKLELVPDSAYITVPSISDNNTDVCFSFMATDDRLKNFIQNGKMIELNDRVDAYDASEIDKIIDDAIIHDVHYYLVKWKNWSKGFSTWERFGAICKCQKLVCDYVHKKYSKKKINDTNYSRPVNGIRLMLSRQNVSKLFDLFRTQTGLSLPVVSPEDISSLFNSLDIGPKRIQINRKKTLILYLNTISLGSYRQQQLVNLKQWELDINLMTQGYQMKVENNIDLEGPPDFFVYTTKYIPQKNVIIPDDPPIGCMCKKNCQESKDCCNEMSGYSSVYDENKCITVHAGHPIFECNKKCLCSSKCNNRVVQLGSKVNICIYKTKFCGWGVKTSENIKKGQFVSQYFGEIITVEESEQRLAKKSSKLDCMWNLDFDDSQNYDYIIDGSHFANFTYFLNHSCNANLTLYAVWINCLDRNLPQLALFASRDIIAGEQLTTNYFSRCAVESLKKTGINCKCYSKNCKGYYF